MSEYFDLQNPTVRPTLDRVGKHGKVMCSGMCEVHLRGKWLSLNKSSNVRYVLHLYKIRFRTYIDK